MCPECVFNEFGRIFKIQPTWSPTRLGTFWMLPISQCFHNVFKMFPGGAGGYIEVTWLGTFQMRSQCTQWKHLIYIFGYILNVLNFFPVGTLESLYASSPNVINMYPVGKGFLVPSVGWSHFISCLVIGSYFCYWSRHSVVSALYMPFPRGN
jgi:hypothetical protein